MFQLKAQMTKEARRRELKLKKDMYMSQLKIV